MNKTALLFLSLASTYSLSAIEAKNDVKPDTTTSRMNPHYVNNPYSAIDTVYYNMVRVITDSGAYMMPQYIFENLKSYAGIKDGMRDTNNTKRDLTIPELLGNSIDMIINFVPQDNPELWDSILKEADYDNNHMIMPLEWKKYYAKIMNAPF